MRITKENLTRYDQHFKSWHRRRLGYGKALENWKQTEEAGAVQFYPVGGSPLEGKVKFSFTETPPVSGDKSPTNPSTIAGVSSIGVRRLGANLAYSAGTYRFSNLGDGFYGATIDNTTGSTTLSGRILYLSNQDLSFLERDKNYCCVIEYQNCDQFSLGNTVGDPLFTTEDGTVSLSGTGIQKINLVVRNVANPTYALRVASDVPSGVSKTFKIRVAILQCTAVEVDLNTYKYDSANNLFAVSLGDVYYGGEVDFATGLMTVTHRIREVSGTPYATTSGENYTKFEYRVSDQIQNTGISNPSSACSHFNNGSSIPDSFYFGLSRLYFCSSDITTGADFSAWLTEQKNAGNPVVVAYKLNTPTTLQLDPLTLTALAQTSRHEPRLNTVYTDADSIQITYQKSPIRAATEQEMAILGLGGNV